MISHIHTTTVAVLDQDTARALYVDVLGWRVGTDNRMGSEMRKEQIVTTILAEHFTAALAGLLDETFEHVHGYYLDEGTSFFETLATISAAEASIAVGGRCATLAAQVKHTAFYLDVLEQNVRSGEFAPADWERIWREVHTVTPDEWEAIKAELRASYARIRALLDDTAEWTGPQQLGGAMATVVHTAYHLGEIRQALCVLKA